MAVVYAVRCRPRNGSVPSMRELRACRPFLLRTISLLAPRIVVGVGGTAYKTISNRGSGSVTKNRGRILDIPGLAVPPTTFITYEPEAVISGATHLKDRIVADLRRASLGLRTPPEKALVPSGAPKTLAVDTEYSPEGVLLTVGLAAASEAGSVEEVETGWPTVRAALDNRPVLVGHSLAGDLSMLAKAGIPLDETWVRGERVLDSLLLARMADENDLSYELENLLLSFQNTPPWKHHTTAISKTDATLWPVDLRMERCRLDAWASLCVARHFYPKLRHQAKLVTYTHRTAAVLERLSLFGAAVDLEGFEVLATELAREREQPRDMLVRLAGQLGIEGFSPTNDNHIRELLYDKLGLAVLGRTAKRKEPSVDKITIAQIPPNNETSRLALENLLAFNSADKLFSTNVTGLREHISRLESGDGMSLGWLPFHINPLGARTGRRSSNSPNSQNWSKRIRRIITSRFAGGSIGAADYKRLEVVLLAWLAGDEKLLRYFTKGRGYVDVAKELFGTDVEEGTDLYKAVKIVVLGVHYNLQTPHMARNLWLAGIKLGIDSGSHEEETDRLRKTYLRKFPGVQRYRSAREEEWSRKGYVTSLTGRVRHLPVPARGERGWGHALNQAINFPVQSLASEVTASAMLDVEEELLRAHGLSYSQWLTYLAETANNILTGTAKRDIFMPISGIFNEVHDEVTVDLHPDHLVRDTELVVETMRAVPSLRALVPTFTCPLDVDLKVTPRWHGQGLA